MPSIAASRLVVGLEIHVELATRSKMFTRAANVAHPDHYDAEPNALVDPLVAALPGTLPVVNRRAVELSMMVGMALGCRIAGRTRWDRKNYFYPDLPKGYQISQYDQPLCAEGELEIAGAAGAPKRIRITRAHLEEDAGKLAHELPGGQPSDGTLVDLNRAGTPLLEIVTEPDFDCADDVVTFARELHAICRFLGVTEGIMQRGHMRFEPNINLHLELDDGTTVATPVVEVKNLNSFRAVHGAIEHEAGRQVEAWRADGLVMGPGMKSTRGWDDAAGVTLPQRSKEDAQDYRYFPDPDLPPLDIDEAWRERVRAEIPELPIARRARYESDYGLAAADALALTEDPRTCALFEDAIGETVSATVDTAAEVDATAAGGLVAKLLLNAGAKRANERGCRLDELGIDAVQVGQVLALRLENAIGSSAADELFGLLCATDAPARVVAEREGLLQVTDAGALAQWVDAAIVAQEQAAADFAAGKDAALGRLVGAVMKASAGQADARAAQALLRERLRGAAGP